MWTIYAGFNEYNRLFQYIPGDSRKNQTRGDDTVEMTRQPPRNAALHSPPYFIEFYRGIPVSEGGDVACQIDKYFKEFCSQQGDPNTCTARNHSDTNEQTLDSPCRLIHQRSSTTRLFIRIEAPPILSLYSFERKTERFMERNMVCKSGHHLEARPVRPPACDHP